MYLCVYVWVPTRVQVPTEGRVLGFPEAKHIGCEPIDMEVQKQIQVFWKSSKLS